MTIKAQKVSLDIWDLMNAQYKHMVVGRKAYDEYRVGQELASQFDGIGFLFDGTLAAYEVTVSKKEIVRRYFFRARGEGEREISQGEFDEVLRQFSTATGRHLTRVPSPGGELIFATDEPLSQLPIVSREPLTRYYVMVHVENSTLTLDLIKHLRNAALTHDFEIEVPRGVYERAGNVWNDELSGSSVALKGRFSTLSGTITKKWTEVDSGYELATLEDGSTIIVPAWQ
ncbi:MAG: hypothetical protein KDD66_15185 [Bdellovibrionales bacterium]|nr:hypothetical protein [Bdellovibrionales bacterium]